MYCADFSLPPPSFRRSPTDAARIRWLDMVPWIVVGGIWIGIPERHFLVQSARDMEVRELRTLHWANSRRRQGVEAAHVYEAIPCA